MADFKVYEVEITVKIPVMAASKEEAMTVATQHFDDEMENPRYYNIEAQEAEGLYDPEECWIGEKVEK